MFIIIEIIVIVNNLQKCFGLSQNESLARESVAKN